MAGAADGYATGIGACSHTRVHAEAAEGHDRVTAMDPDYPEAWLRRGYTLLNRCAGTGTGRTDSGRDDTRDKWNCGAYPWKKGRSTS